MVWLYFLLPQLHSLVVSFHFFSVSVSVRLDVPSQAAFSFAYTHRPFVAFHILGSLQVHVDVVALHSPPDALHPVLGSGVLSTGAAQYPHSVLALVSI